MDWFDEVFGPGGPLAAKVPGFSARPQQVEMARAVDAAMRSGESLIVEAGTGTGKTFAYLVPALALGERVILSTGTRTLQDQLFARDLPTIRAALGLPRRVALLKGRSNYLCLHRLALALDGGRFRSREDAAMAHAVGRWAGHTKSGDIAEFGELAEDAPLWYQLTSTAENCVGGSCPSYADCHVVRARRAALDADLVVINHHLFFADLALREEGFGELLPGASAFVFDEAHQLPEIAGAFFGQSVTARQCLDLARDARLERVREAVDMAELDRDADRFEKAVRDFRLAFGEQPRRVAWSEALARNLPAALQELQQALGALGARLESAASRGTGLQSCWQRATGLAERLAAVTGEAGDAHVQWADLSARGFALHRTPLDVGGTLRAQREGQGVSWIFTSATLAVGESFEHFAGRCGLEDVAARRWESPFDFGSQALLYLPEDMPDPSGPGFNAAVLRVATEVIEASGGRTFVLFTSHRALAEAERELDGRLPYPLLVQGSAPRNELLARFREAGNAVLLGTASFWEGVDVRGEALTAVVIDRLPFASPGDPVLAARLDALKRAGGDAFRQHQLPAAVIALKQGVGRLIRDEDDYGVLAICDPRILTKSYGRTFRASLPPAPVTRRMADVRAFFDQRRSESAPRETGS